MMIKKAQNLYENADGIGDLISHIFDVDIDIRYSNVYAQDNNMTIQEAEHELKCQKSKLVYRLKIELNDQIRISNELLKQL